MTVYTHLVRVLYHSHTPPRHSPYTFVTLACHLRLPSRGSCMSIFTVVVKDLGCELIHRHSNFVVAITFPRLLGAFKPQGAFGWYAGWNIIGFVAILLFVPETKALSLEELDQGKSSDRYYSNILFMRMRIQFFLCRHLFMRHTKSRHCPTTSRSTSSA